MTLKELRLRAGLKQKEVCERTGLKQNQMSQYEHGCNAPGLLVIRKLAKVLGCTADEIVFSETWEEKE